MKREDLFELVDASTALQLLKAGNQNFVNDCPAAPSSGSVQRKLLAEKGQCPFAVILSCSDSRVSPEIVFDVGIGQLFVVRTAGNVVDAIAIGSVEYAVEHLHSRLVVVLGHSKCGAVAAAMDGGDQTLNIESIIAEIPHCCNKMRKAGGCENENVRHTVARLMESAVLAEHVRKKELVIVGAKYNLETGEVDFGI